jgi:ribosomal protein S18 acetylase RimI-like enzyme
MFFFNAIIASRLSSVIVQTVIEYLHPTLPPLRMTIRPYNQDDLEAVAALFTATVRHINIADYSPEQIAVWAPQPPDLVYWRQRLDGLTLWVGVSGQTIIGFCGLGGNGHVDFLYVDHRFQRQGVARQLYGQLETHARQNGISRLYTEASITARQFFERVGFKIIREQTVVLRGANFTNFVMEKII